MPEDRVYKKEGVIWHPIKACCLLMDFLQSHHLSSIAKNKPA